MIKLRLPTVFLTGDCTTVDLAARQAGDAHAQLIRLVLTNSVALILTCDRFPRCFDLETCWSLVVTSGEALAELGGLALGGRNAPKLPGGYAPNPASKAVAQGVLTGIGLRLGIEVNGIRGYIGSPTG